jgi:hypothetical protein
MQFLFAHARVLLRRGGDNKWKLEEHWSGFWPDVQEAQYRRSEHCAEALKLAAAQSFYTLQVNTLKFSRWLPGAPACVRPYCRALCFNCGRGEGLASQFDLLYE